MSESIPRAWQLMVPNACKVGTEAKRMGFLFISNTVDKIIADESNGCRGLQLELATDFYRLNSAILHDLDLIVTLVIDNLGRSKLRSTE